MLGIGLYKYSADAAIRANGETIEVTISGVYKSVITNGSDEGKLQYEIWLERTYGGETYQGRFHEKTHLSSDTWEYGDSYEIIVDKDHPDQWCKTENSMGTVCVTFGILTALFGMMWLYFLVDWIRWKRNMRIKEISENSVDI